MARFCSKISLQVGELLRMAAYAAPPSGRVQRERERERESTKVKPPNLPIHVIITLQSSVAIVLRAKVPDIRHLSDADVSGNAVFNLVLFATYPRGSGNLISYYYVIDYSRNQPI
jgi:hypothetical protein